MSIESKSANSVLWREVARLFGLQLIGVVLAIAIMVPLHHLLVPKSGDWDVLFGAFAVVLFYFGFCTGPAWVFALGRGSLDSARRRALAFRVVCADVVLVMLMMLPIIWQHLELYLFVVLFGLPIATIGYFATRLGFRLGSRA
jgi:hypothetical protein